jgi:hypothetical protein
MANLEVNPDQIFQDSGSFDGMAEKAYEIGENLDGGIEGVKGLPVGDKTTDEFLGVFLPSARGISELLTGFGDGMRKTGGDLGTTAALYALSNKVNEESVPTTPRVRG